MVSRALTALILFVVSDFSFADTEIKRVLLLGDKSTPSFTKFAINTYINADGSAVEVSTISHPKKYDGLKFSRISRDGKQWFCVSYNMFFTLSKGHRKNIFSTIKWNPKTKGVCFRETTNNELPVSFTPIKNASSKVSVDSGSKSIGNLQCHFLETSIKLKANSTNKQFPDLGIMSVEAKECRHPTIKDPFLTGAGDATLPEKGISKADRSLIESYYKRYTGHTVLESIIRFENLDGLHLSTISMKNVTVVKSGYELPKNYFIDESSMLPNLGDRIYSLVNSSIMRAMTERALQAEERTAPKAFQPVTCNTIEINRCKPFLTQVRACFEELLQRNPKATGKVQVEATVLTTGRIHPSMALTSTIEDSRFERCIKQRFRALTISGPKTEGNRLVKIPFSFKPL